jgi:hypothetical protein
MHARPEIREHLLAKKNATLGADRSPQQRIPAHVACQSPQEFFAAACEVSADRTTFGLDRTLGLPAPVVMV